MDKFADQRYVLNLLAAWGGPVTLRDVAVEMGEGLAVAHAALNALRNKRLVRRENDWWSLACA